MKVQTRSVRFYNLRSSDAAWSPVRKQHITKYNDLTLDWCSGHFQREKSISCLPLWLSTAGAAAESLSVRPIGADGEGHETWTHLLSPQKRRCSRWSGLCVLWKRDARVQKKKKNPLQASCLGRIVSATVERGQGHSATELRGDVRPRSRRRSM